MGLLTVIDLATQENGESQLINTAAAPASLPAKMVQMKTKLGHLPFEVLCMIAEDLSACDQKNCTRVCQEWNAIFRRILYSVIDTDKRSKFYEFREAVRTRSDAPDNVGPYVRKLIVRDGYMTQKEMNEFKAYCPNVQHLTFRYKDDAAHRKLLIWLTEHDAFHATRKFFGIPRQLLETLSTPSLTLICDDRTGPGQPKPALDISYCKIYLTGCSHLHTLNLIRVFCNVSLDLIDSINTECPNLVALCIRSYASKTGLPSSRPERIVVDKAKERRNLKRLRHLSLETSTISEPHVIHWFEYFANQYPELEVLKIDACGAAHKLTQTEDELQVIKGAQMSVSCLLNDVDAYIR